MFLRKIIGIDFGTTKSRVVLPHKDFIFEQPTIIALEKKTKAVVAVGEGAEEMVGKAPNDIEIIRPLKNSVLANYRASESFLRYLINQSTGRFSLYKPIVVVSVPSLITSVEKRALEEAVINAGASEVYFFPISYLAAIGSNLEIHKPLGNMIVNVGAGTTESAVLSFNGIVVSNSTKTGSIAINDAIINYFKKVYGLIIGENMSEKIKITICSAIPVDKQRSIEVRGRDATTGMPKSVVVHTNDMVDVIKPVISHIILTVRSVLEKTPPELSSDIVDNGIMATGAGIYLDNLTTLMVKALGIPVISSENPELATAYGLKKVIEDFDVYAYKGKS